MSRMSTLIVFSNTDSGMSFALRCGGWMFRSFTLVAERTGMKYLARSMKSTYFSYQPHAFHFEVGDAVQQRRRLSLIDLEHCHGIKTVHASRLRWDPKDVNTAQICHRGLGLIFLPDRPRLPKLVSVRCSPRQQSKVGLPRSSKSSTSTKAFMLTRQMPDRSDQDNLTIRLATQADAAALSAVHALCWHQAYGKLLPKDMLATVTAESRLPARHRILADASVVCYVATSESGIVGFVDCGPYRGEGRDCRGEVYALYVLQSFHDRRVGLRLLSCCATALAGQGYSSMHLWSLEGNARARRFYDSTGGTLLGRRASVRGSMVLIEVEYQWDLIGLKRLAAD